MLREVLISLQCTVQEQTAGECWRMLTEWAQLSTELSSHRPQKRVTASQVGALALSAKEALEDSEAAAETLCDSLQEGWRPILVGGVAPCIAHVPWLDHIDSLAAAFGTSQPVSDTCGTEVATLDTRTNQECSAAEVCVLHRCEPMGAMFCLRSSMLTILRVCAQPSFWMATQYLLVLSHSQW